MASEGERGVLGDRLEDPVVVGARSAAAEIAHAHAELVGFAVAQRDLLQADGLVVARNASGERLGRAVAGLVCPALFSIR